VGLNESLFRQVNEQIESLQRDSETDLPTMTAICECANADCTEQLEISVSAYEEVRTDPHRYIVAPGHALTGYESVVEHADGYDVVEKRDGTVAELAEETDPRS
jgi:hypothetical protein